MQIARCHSKFKALVHNNSSLQTAFEWNGFCACSNGEVKHTVTSIRKNGIFIPHLLRLRTLELSKHPIRNILK